jgi:four helix bundle suffix protein
MDRTDKTDKEPLIPKHGGYRKLKSFQVAQLVYDVTARFCDRYIDKRSRTHDQMVQAARSGVQNIAEGSQVSATSKRMELKLTSVARASLEELRLDYEDFLRQRRLTIWNREDQRRSGLIRRRPATADDVAQWIREVHGQPGQDGRATPRKSFPKKSIVSMPSMKSMPPPSTKFTSSTPSMKSMPSTKSTYPEIAANGALALIAVAVSLLNRQIAAQAKAFENEGGFTERLYRTRTSRRRAENDSVH